MMNDKNQNTNAPEVRRILPVMLKVENLHIHLDERSTSNTYFNGVEDQDEEPDIDIEAMIATICTKTGLCKDAVVMVLDAQAEYLDSVYGEDAEDEDKLLPPTKLPAVNTAPRVQDVPHPRKKPGKRSRKQEQDTPSTMDETPKEPTEEAQAEESPAEEAKEELPDFPDDSADDLPFDVDTAQKAEPEQPAVTISKDEITAVIVAKIKQKRSNNEKIGQLLKTYGVDQLSELPTAKYEAFLADISQL